MHDLILKSAVNSLVGRSKRRGEDIKLSGCPAHGRLVMDRSTTWGGTPARTYVFTVFNYARHGRVVAGVREHFSAPGAIVLRVVVDKGNAFGVVVIPRLLAVRTSRLCINY